MVDQFYTEQPKIRGWFSNGQAAARTSGEKTCSPFNGSDRKKIYPCFICMKRSANVFAWKSNAAALNVTLNDRKTSCPIFPCTKTEKRGGRPILISGSIIYPRPSGSHLFFQISARGSPTTILRLIYDYTRLLSWFAEASRYSSAIIGPPIGGYLRKVRAIDASQMCLTVSGQAR